MAVVADIFRSIKKKKKIILIRLFYYYYKGIVPLKTLSDILH